LSGADINIKYRLDDLLEMSGINVRSIIAIGPKTYAAGGAHSYDDDVAANTILPEQQEAVYTLDVMGRRYSQSPEGLESISQDNIQAFGQKYLPGGGIILLSTQNEPSAIIKVKDYSKLRPVHLNILKEAEKRAASAFMVYNESKNLSPADMRNLEAFGRNTNLQWVTAYDKSGDRYHEVESLVRAGRNESTIFYSLGEQGAGKSGIPASTVQSIVDKVTAGLISAPDIKVIQSVSELDSFILQDMKSQNILDENGNADVQGVAYQGKIWLVCDNVSSTNEATQILAHELTHDGLGTFLNQNKDTSLVIKSIRHDYNTLMDAIYQAHEDEVTEIAQTTHAHLKVGTLEGRRQAAEEWLCNQAYGAQLKWYDRLVSIFHDLLRAMGVDVKLSDAEVRTALRDAFKTFGDKGSKVRYMVAAWHGGSDLEGGKFDLGRNRHDQGRGQFGYGLYFSDMDEIGKKYAEEAAKDKGSKERHLYRVTLHKGKEPGQYDFLDWQGPLTDRQAGKLKKYLSDKYANDPRFGDLKNIVNANLPGNMVYRVLSSAIGGDRNASAFLQDAGVDGVRYSADSIYGTNTGATNYVVFDENAVTVEEHIKYQRKELDAPASISKIRSVDEIVKWLNEQSQPGKQSTPISSPNQKQSKFSKDMLSAALKLKILEAGDEAEVVGYDVDSGQQDMAADLVTNDYEQAKKVAFGEENPPGKVKEGTVALAVAIRALAEGDIDTIKGIVRSKASLGLTEAGQTLAANRRDRMLAAMGVQYFENPVNAIEDVEAALLDSVEKRTGRKPTKEDIAKKEELEKIVAEKDREISELKRLTSQEYIDELVKQKIAELGLKEKPHRERKPRIEYGSKNKLVTREMYEQSKKEWRSLFSAQLNAGIDPKAITILTKIGTYHFEAGARKFAAWSARVIEDTGEGVKPYLKETFGKVKHAFGQGLIDKIQKGVEKGRDLGELHQSVNEMAKSFIEQGITDRNELVNAVHAELQKIIPDITIPETEDAISGYGKWKPLTHDEVLDRWRAIKGELQQVAKLRDMQEGRVPRKTGMERHEMSQEERNLIRLVNEMKKKYGFEVTDPEHQLRSALESYKRRLENQIADYEKEIETKEKIVKEKYDLKLDQAAARLKAARDRLKAQRDAIFAAPKRSKADILNDARVKRLDKQIAALEKQIATRTRILKAKSNIAPNEKVLELTARRDALKAAYDSVFGKPEMTDEQKLKIAIEAAKKEAAEYSRRIAEHDFSPVLKHKVTLTSEELDRAKKERDSARQAYQELREIERPGAIALKALNTRLHNEMNRYRDMIKTRNFAKKEKHSLELTPELKKLKEERDLLKQGLKAASEAAGQLTDEEMGMITKLASVVTELREAMDQGGSRLDYGAAVVAYHNYLTDLKGIHAPLKTLLKNRLQQFRSEIKENPGAAAFKLAADSIRTISDNSIAIVASADISYPFRQGLKILFTHPSVWLKGSENAVMDFVKTIGGKATHDAMMADIYSRPNYLNGNYRKAGIIADFEEQYPASLAERVPALGRVFKASEEAFVGAGMRMRTDLYDLLSGQAQGNGVNVGDKGYIESLGKLINNLTARGVWGKRGDNRAVRLVLWAPKMLMANINTLLATDVWHQNNGTVAKEAAKNTLKIIGTTALLMAIAGVFGGDDDDIVEWDPRSSDFGKIKTGDTRFDITGGMSSIVVLAARIITGEKKSATTGIITPYDSGFGKQSRFDALIDFLANKTTPPVGIIRDWLKGKTPTGERFEASKAAYRAFTPIAVQNFVKLSDNASADRIAGAIVDIFGINANSYADSEVEWSPEDSNKMKELASTVSKAKFRELNDTYNKRVNEYVKSIRKSTEWKAMSSEDKRKEITNAKRQIKEELIGK
jgi:hypothetical protein